MSFGFNSGVVADKYIKHNISATTLEDCKRFLLTFKKIYRPSCLTSLAFRCQGTQPGIGGVSAVTQNVEVKDIYHMRDVVKGILTGNPPPEITDFIRRASTKVSNAYACSFRISGYDMDGDSIDYELKFKTQDELITFCSEGIIGQLPREDKYLLS